MPSRISPTLLICMIGAAIAVGALFLPPLDVAAPTPPAPAVTSNGVSTGPVEVSIENFTFTATGDLQPGQQVLVTNNDSAPHTLTADDGSFDTGLLQPGEQGLITMPVEPGQFTFFCEVHPSMTGAFGVSA